MVLVQFRVRVPDVGRFKATQEKFLPTMERLGGRNNRAYVAESDPPGGHDVQRMGVA